MNRLLKKHETLEKQHETLEKRHTENPSRLRDFEILESELNKQKAMYSTQSHEVARLNTQAMKLSREQQASEGHIERLTQQYHGMEEQIRTAQLAMSKKSSRPRVGLAEEERTIVGHFENLHVEIRKWAKTWGNVQFAVVQDLRGEERQRFSRQLAEVVVLKNGNIPNGIVSKGKDDKDRMIKSTLLCISAMLGKYICTEVLESPFRPLGKRRAGSEHSPGDENTAMASIPTLDPSDEVLNQLYHKLSKLHHPQAQVWRSIMMNILDPTVTDSSTTSLIAAQEGAFERRAQAARDMTLAFLGTSVSVLLAQRSPEDIVVRDEQLRAIFQDAFNIAGRLWKQLTIVQCVYLEELNEEEFRYESELMAAHPFHKLGVDDEEDSRLDKRDIKIMVFPAVKGFGNSEGEKYDQSRVWGKAIVWLDEN